MPTAILRCSCGQKLMIKGTRPAKCPKCGGTVSPESQPETDTSDYHLLPAPPKDLLRDPASQRERKPKSKNQKKAKRQLLPAIALVLSLLLAVSISIGIGVVIVRHRMPDSEPQVLIDPLAKKWAENAADKNPATRAEGFRELVKMGPDSVPYLIELVQHPDKAVGELAATAILKVSPFPTGEIIRLCSSKAINNRVAGFKLAATLQKRSRQLSADKRASLIQDLKPLIPVAIDCLDSHDLELAMSSMSFLGTCETAAAAAVDPLERLAKSGDPKISEDAKMALKAIVPEKPSNENGRNKVAPIAAAGPSVKKPAVEKQDIATEKEKNDATRLANSQKAKEIEEDIERSYAEQMESIRQEIKSTQNRINRMEKIAQTGKGRSNAKGVSVFNKQLKSLQEKLQILQAECELKKRRSTHDIMKEYSPYKDVDGQLLTLDEILERKTFGDPRTVADRHMTWLIEQGGVKNAVFLRSERSGWVVAPGTFVITIDHVYQVQYVNKLGQIMERQAKLRAAEKKPGVWMIVQDFSYPDGLVIE